MKFIVYSKGSRGKAVVDALFGHGLTPEQIYCENIDPELTTIARVRNSNVHHCPNPKDPEHVNSISKISPALIVAAGYSRIIPPEILSIPTFGVINCHGGRLPTYRGAAPIPWQIMRGERDGGAYVLVMTEDVDDGPVLASEPYEIGENETATDIVRRVDEIFARLVPAVVRAFSSGLPPVPSPQPPGTPCLWTRRFPRDGYIDWNNATAEEVRNLVRALNAPYPGAFTFFGGQRILVNCVEILSPAVCGVPGRFVGLRSGYPTIIAKDRAVSVLSYCVEGGGNRNFPAKYGDDAK